METLLALDQALFFAVNLLPHHAITDTIAQLFSGVGSAGLLWFIVALWLLDREERKNHWFLVVFFFTCALSYVGSELILKPLVGRLRPDTLSSAVVVSEALGYSFPSTHASVSFAAAAIVSTLERRYAGMLFILAGLISFSRIYLGHHYPADVVAGSLLGLSIGFFSRGLLVKQLGKGRHSKKFIA